MDNKALTVAFVGGGTGGHIYPGLAVADSLRQKFIKAGRDVKIIWLGSLSKMDKEIVLNSVDKDGRACADKFYGVPSGKLRRYFSLQNFFDLFKIFFGFVCAFFILLKNRPAFLFSKGGFVSVPPCAAARLLGIKVYTHECDFTPGLATRINFKFASKVLLSYEETKEFFSNGTSPKFVVTGNPVRPAFYQADARLGLEFLGVTAAQKKAKPILLVMGGSLGAAQINELVWKNLSWLCERFIVVHQTGQKNAALLPSDLTEEEKAAYHPYAFIYKEMPSVIACADIVLSRAGANSIWECASLKKPMVLVPLEGAGTRGDQVDNAEYFERRGAAIVLTKSAMTETSVQSALSSMASAADRKKFAAACEAMLGQEKPSEKIADILAEGIL
ncbi:MAG: UDP-N-acetylglucosamine--N-acetylmuramyl-(pentapeptide) pyrophosphoryl-undecaprenol N-acetylglucosamine transferase [Treponema sp.]|nr:UDP-N-acetylglucosamine--N-acetylmuramyl-(pentapeptide) pyrophosphoryl-undecaprenol N-acetylglucosamine transferase [Treponema sp.]